MLALARARKMFATIPLISTPCPAPVLALHALTEQTMGVSIINACACVLVQRSLLEQKWGSSSVKPPQPLTALTYLTLRRVETTEPGVRQGKGSH